MREKAGYRGGLFGMDGNSLFDCRRDGRMGGFLHYT